MDRTVSVSKGVFVFNNEVKSASANKRKSSHQITSNSIYADEPWHVRYSQLWKLIETKIQKLNNEMFLSVLKNLIKFIQISYKNFVSEIPVAALLTGINMPDHAAQYLTLADEIKKTVTPHVVCLSAQECQSVKCLIESVVYQLINEYDDSEDDFTTIKKTIKKSQCNLSVLQAWYEDLYYNSIKRRNESPSKRQKVKNESKALVLIISDFEGFSDKVLQEFILIASSYLNILPFVLVFGIATTVAVLHRSLPYHVMSKINVQIFNSPTSGVCLNNVLEKIFLRSDVPFHLGGKVFNLFIDIFLFYNISVTSFVQNFKYAMLEHFSQSNVMALCCKCRHTSEVLADLSHEDLEDARRLLSFRRLVENETFENRIKLFKDDQYFRNVLSNAVLKIHEYLRVFHIFLNCLHILVADLPKTPLGKHIRDLYAVVISSDFIKSQEYKDCLLLLNMQSKDEFHIRIYKIYNLVVEQMKNVQETKDELKTFTKEVVVYLDQMNNLSMCDEECSTENEEDEDITLGITDRQKLKLKLLQKSKTAKSFNKYEKIRFNLLNYLTGAFEKYLHKPDSLNFYEIFFFDDISIQDHIVSSHRAAIHSALIDPHSYLKCSCCEISSDSKILRTMPDISIVYKLHLECGKLINLYDWMQAFLSIVESNEMDEDDGDDDVKKIVDPNLQARFTQAVAELEFLGFIKSSKKKTDHVMRLTWGG